jgi:hypothetical protein
MPNVFQNDSNSTREATPLEEPEPEPFLEEPEPCQTGPNTSSLGRLVWIVTICLMLGGDCVSAWIGLGLELDRTGQNKNPAANAAGRCARHGPLAIGSLP